MDIRQQLTQLRKDIEEVRKDTTNIKKNVAKECADQVYEDLDYIFVACIDKFYADYDPMFYRREGSLYHTYKLTNRNGIISRNFGAQYMPQAYEHSHRVQNQYIYDQMFLQGYHGGAHTIDPEKVEQWGAHPKDGTPLYRTPYPSRGIKNPYIRWSERKVKQSTPPADDIREQLRQYESGKASTIGRGIEDAINGAWDLVLNRYNLFTNY